MGLYGVPRARTSKRDNVRLARVRVRKRLGMLGLAYMRERESTQLFGTTK